MKTSNLGILLLVCAVLETRGQSLAPAINQTLPVPTPYAVVSQDGNSSVWERTVYELDPQGQAVPKEHSYTELASGLNFWSGNAWKESKEEIDVLPQGGAEAVQGQHQAYFPADIYQGEIKEVTPDGVQLQSRPLGLGYFDGTNTVLIAELTNSTGVQTSPNQVIYPNAFAGVDADLQYTYTKAGFEQDVILRAQPPAPEAFGLVSRNSRLQVLTEFFNPPQPKVTAGLAGSLPDENLDFGVTKMVPGKAFLMGTNSPSVPVGKQWVQVEGRQFLVEEIPVAGIAAELDSLPPPTAQVSSQTHLPMATRQLVLPPQHLAKDVPAMPMQLASLPARGLVLDYVTLNSSTNNCTFQGDTTYYISGSSYLSGTITIEGGAVLKFTNSGTINGTYGTPLISTAGPYRMAILTSKDDNSVGETISGSTGSPSISGAAYVSLNLGSTGASTLAYLRFAYAGTGISQAMGSGSINVNPVWNCQFVNCGTAISDAANYYSPGTPAYQTVENVLFSDCYTAVTNSRANSSYGCMITLTGENVTADQVTNLLASWSGDTAVSYYSSLKNSILTGVQNQILYCDTSGTTTISTNDCYVGSTGLYNFQTVGGGNYYLANNSLRDVGSTGINATLLAQLRQKTTWPPVLYSNVTVSANTTLSPQAQRDTNSSPDLGYHYDPVDYFLDNFAITNGAALTITNGAVIAFDNDSAGIWLQDGSSIFSIGTPLYPNWIVHYASVQEQPVAIGPYSFGTGIAVNSYHFTNAAPTGIFYFTKFAGPANGDYFLYHYQNTWNYTNLLVQDCEFWGGQDDFSGSSNGVATLNNSLFWRSAFSAIPLNSSARSCLYVTNNLFWKIPSVVFGQHLSAAGATNWCVFNNDFDSCGSVGSASVSMTNGCNAYLNTGGRLYPTNACDIVSTNSVAYQTGPLGTFYQPTNSPLINAGSTTADQVGLYHFTTQTNQTPETNSVVDIGYHYVATDAYGNPLETLWSGIPDYLDDPNGALAAWEMAYFGHTGLDPDSDPNGDGHTLLYDYLNGLDPNIIQFSIEAANDYVNVTNPSVQLDVTAGVPGSYAVLVNGGVTTNWLAYTSSNLTVNLGTTDGVYDVNIGLRSSPANSAQTWEDYSFTVDRVAPVVVITNLSSLSGSRPFIDPAGYTTKSLSSLTFDVTNSLGAAYSDQGSVVDQQCNPADMNHATNWFVCLDVALTLGTNHIGIHAVDWAGNVTVTNFSYIFDTNGDTTPPAIAMTWPQDGMEVSGTSFTLRGMLDDDTATVSGQYADTNGVMQTVSGLVERGGRFWLENVPLNPGTNIVTVTATDAAGNSSTTSLTLIQSGVSLTMDAVSADQLNQVQMNVTGEISEPAYAVWVNGVQGTNNGDGTWDATNVPVTAGGTASFDMTAYPPGYAPGGGSWTNFAVEDESYPNPLPADPAQAHVDWDKPAAVYVKANKYNFTEFETPVKGGLTASVAVDQDWSQGVGGYWNENYYGPLGHGWQGSFEPETWPADAGYLPVLSGQGYDYYSNSIPQSSVSTNAVNPNFEWIEVVSSASGSFTDDPNEGLFVQWAETAGQVVELFTGGKALRQDKSLFVLSQALSAEDFDTNYYEVEPVAAIPPTQITLGDLGNLSASGTLTNAFANGQNEVITARAPVPWFGGGLPVVQNVTKHIYISVDTSAPSPGVPSTFNAKNIGSSLGAQLTTKLALPKGAIKARVSIESVCNYSLGWSVAGNFYVCRVTWGTQLPGGGLSEGGNNQVTIDPIACRNYNTGSDPPTQFWVNDLAHEVVWLNIYGGVDHDMSPPQGEISSGQEPPLTSEFTISPANQSKLCTTFGF